MFSPQFRQGTRFFGAIVKELDGSELNSLALVFLQMTNLYCYNTYEN